jgi:hypothetical protein
VTTDLESCFDDFTRSAFRLETFRLYTGAADETRFAAWRRHEPLPDRSVRTSPWLARLAVTTAGGKLWQRVRVMESPPSEYERFETIAYVESAAAGEEIRIASRSPELADLDRDFWLFDAGTSHVVAALMSYDAQGRYEGADITTNPGVISDCIRQRDLAITRSVPLNVYLARREPEPEAA